MDQSCCLHLTDAESEAPRGGATGALASRGCGARGGVGCCAEGRGILGSLVPPLRDGFGPSGEQSPRLPNNLSFSSAEGGHGEHVTMGTAARAFLGGSLQSPRPGAWGAGGAGRKGLPAPLGPKSLPSAIRLVTPPSQRPLVRGVSSSPWVQWTALLGEGLGGWVGGVDGDAPQLTAVARGSAGRRGHVGRRAALAVRAAGSGGPRGPSAFIEPGRSDPPPLPALLLPRGWGGDGAGRWQPEESGARWLDRAP